MCGSPGRDYHRESHRSVVQEQTAHVCVGGTSRKARCESCEDPVLRWEAQRVLGANRDGKVGVDAYGGRDDEI